MDIRIYIYQDKFNDEYNADIGLSIDNNSYLASDNLDELMNTIKQRVLEFNNESS